MSVRRCACTNHLLFTTPSTSIATPLPRLLAGEFAGVLAELPPPPALRTADVLFRSLSFDGVRAIIGMGEEPPIMADSDDLLSGDDDDDCAEVGLLVPFMAELGLLSGEAPSSEPWTPLTRAADSGLPSGEAPTSCREDGLLAACPLTAESGLLIGDDKGRALTGDDVAPSGAVPSRRWPFAAWCRGVPVICVVTTRRDWGGWVGGR